MAVNCESCCVVTRPFPLPFVRLLDSITCVLERSLNIGFCGEPNCIAFIPLGARRCGRAKSFVFRFESSLALEKKHLVWRFFRSRITSAFKSARIVPSILP